MCEHSGKHARDRNTGNIEILVTWRGRRLPGIHVLSLSAAKPLRV